MYTQVKSTGLLKFLMQPSSFHFNNILVDVKLYFEFLMNIVAQKYYLKDDQRKERDENLNILQTMLSSIKV